MKAGYGGARDGRGAPRTSPADLPADLPDRLRRSGRPVDRLLARCRGGGPRHRTRRTWSGCRAVVAVRACRGAGVSRRGPPPPRV